MSRVGNGRKKNNICTTDQDLLGDIDYNLWIAAIISGSSSLFFSSRASAFLPWKWPFISLAFFHIISWKMLKMESSPFFCAKPSYVPQNKDQRGSVFIKQNVIIYINVNSCGRKEYYPEVHNLNSIRHTRGNKEENKTERVFLLVLTLETSTAEVKT